MYIAALVIGMVLLAFGGQAAIRLLLDGSQSLPWLPGGFAVELIVYVLIALAGAVLAGWGADRARKAGQLP